MKLFPFFEHQKNDRCPVKGEVHISSLGQYSPMQTFTNATKYSYYMCIMLMNRDNGRVRKRESREMCYHWNSLGLRVGPSYEYNMNLRGPHYTNISCWSACHSRCEQSKSSFRRPADWNHKGEIVPSFRRYYSVYRYNSEGGAKGSPEPTQQ